MNLFEKTSNALAEKMYLVAGAAIVAMMLLTCTDVVLRYFRRPVPGTYELVCFLGAVAVSFAMAYTCMEKGHVSVSFVVQFFPNRIRALIEVVTGILGLFFFSLIAWQCVIYANDLRMTGEVSLTLEFPFYPFVYGIGFSAGAVCLVLTNDLIYNIKKLAGR